MIRNKPKVTHPQLGIEVEDRYVKYVPKTERGRRMLELRRAIERSGAKILSSEEVREEVRLRRGGID